MCLQSSQFSHPKKSTPVSPLVRTISPSRRALGAGFRYFGGHIVLPRLDQVRQKVIIGRP